MTLPLEHGLLFAHTPKTAGTSFRKALLEELGAERVICDYGQGNVTTSPFIEEHFHASGDSYHFGEKLETLTEVGQRFCLTGHFSLPRFSAFFPAGNVVMFVREPLQQVLSNYAHKCRVNGFDGSLEDFCKLTTSRDVQAKTLSSFPLYLVGYVGLQEQYVASLAAINRLFDLSLQERVTNVNKERLEGSRYEYSEEDEAIIREWNQRDFTLYEKAHELFFQRRQLESEGHYFAHGCVREQTTKRIAGWVVRHGDKHPVELSICVNDVEVAQVKACGFNLALKGWNAPRQGFGAFAYAFKNPLDESDVVECRVSETGQLLFKH